MPKEHSRITLEITDIRVERVQDITDDAILNEGIEYPADSKHFDMNNRIDKTKRIRFDFEKDI